MTYTATEMNATMTGRMNRLAGGSIRLKGAADELINTTSIDTPAGTVTGATLTLSGMPKTTTPALTGTAIAKAELVDSAGVVRQSTTSVGLSGSGAQVIVSSLTPAAGSTVRIDSYTLTDTNA